MKKLVYSFLVVTLLLLLTLGVVSAASSNSAAFNHRYQGPSGSSSSNYYYKSSNDGSGYYDHYGRYRYPIQQHADKPIFKGSYGNYRYQGYAAGDVRPSFFFVDYPESFNRPYFSGGVGGAGLSYGGWNRGVGGFGGFGGFGGYGLGYNPYYSYNNYGNNFYPTAYSYQYLGGCGVTYC